METAIQMDSEELTLQELCARKKLRLSWAYERSRRNELPGQRRYGRLVRVRLDEFERGVAEGVLAK